MLRIFFSFSFTIVGAIFGCAYAQTAEEFCRSFPANQYAGCMTTRAYVTKAKIVVAKKIDAACFPDQPDGFSVKYLLGNDTKVINDAVTASVAKMASQLYGKEKLKKAICKW